MLKLARIIEREGFKGSPEGEQMKLLALKNLVNGIGALERAKKEFLSYHDLVKKRRENTEQLEDFFDVSDVDPDDVIMVVRHLDDLIVTMRTSTANIEDDYSDDELEKQVVYRRK